MNPSTALRLIALAITVLIIGCAGGRGSSGFDLREEQIIEQALDTDMCVPIDGLLICPANAQRSVTPSPPITQTPTPTGTPIDATVTPTPTGTPIDATVTPTPTPTVVAQPAIDTSLDDAPFIYCVAQPRGRCSFDFVFTVSGFPATAVFRVAARVPDAGPPWRLQAAPILDASTVPPTYQASAIVNGDAGADVQIVILAFLDGAVDVPTQFARLADSGADLAFVSPPLPVRVAGGT